MKISLLFAFIALLSFGMSGGENELVGERLVFVSNASELAIQEMRRTNVPASIKIAQSIVETNWGTSILAREANNYFGIKCKSWWTGTTFYKVDDDRDASGKLIPSCFRSYNAMQESFADHSDFLKTSPFYTPLFKLDPLDYKGWANGLKSCGYATDKSYATKLIDIIETYNLNKYDEIALYIE